MNYLKPPILFTFRRCPYAMRARLALWSSLGKVEIREVILRDKPASMLEYSSKGTVPVLVLPNGEVIDESRDIIFWALQKNDPDQWLRADKKKEVGDLLDENDFSFKEHLDQYKYAVRHPDEPMETYRQRGEQFLTKLEERLKLHKYLIDDEISVADISIFPFIRQFAFVDKAWFAQSHYTELQNWLDHFLNSDLFNNIMNKYPQWQSGDKAVFNVL
ncbi:MAG: glutathione S-transferase [Lentisphaeraceae bacterium]|nr:glutathione S-transferase [Lentisphaeraceae bacterium]